ncbi:hypothetical protein V8G54_028252 [Vigna mungo]|uniref:Uncharacterized protein n=1 Tax=Vigna mungo TaxID=3915 RepID=A0AAQ3RJ82_VIGMU
MKERNSGLRNGSSKTKRTGLFKRITAAFPLPLILIYKKVSSTFLQNLSLFWHINEGIEEIMAERIRICSPRNYPKLDLGLFEIVLLNRNQRCFLVYRFFYEQIKEPNGSNSLDWYLDLMRVEMEVG